MNENDKHFIKRYEELLDKGYCDCNEMNCIDNNSPRRILNIVNNLQSKIDKATEILGQYKHLSSPTEEQANEQEEIVSNAYDILKEDK